jgi:hypothetical protein
VKEWRRRVIFLVESARLTIMVLIGWSTHGMFFFLPLQRTDNFPSKNRKKETEKRIKSVKKKTRETAIVEDLKKNRPNQ